MPQVIIRRPFRELTLPYQGRLQLSAFLHLRRCLSDVASGRFAWFKRSDPRVEEALYDSAVMRQFVGIDLGPKPVPDETKVCKFGNLLEEQQLGWQILETVSLLLQSRGVQLASGR